MSQNAITETPHLLIIGFVWPEPNSSAAGIRMQQLISLFITHQWKITFASAAKPTDHIDTTIFDNINISTVSIEMNHSSFDLFIQKLNPSIVLFDRFMTEEQFGWRVTQHCPKALKILNTEDLHSLRKTRQHCFNKKKTFKTHDLLESDDAKREIASIYRCDLTLIISDFEMNLLEDIFKIPKHLLFYLPFLLNPIKESQINWLQYEERTHFMTIGNFRHEPNWNSICYLKEIIWPLISQKLPNAELHVYGAYPPPKAMRLNNPKEKFYIKGWAKDSKKVMEKARICLAPLQFGAGIKGKLIEAMQCGTPSITTTIGIEGISTTESTWNGYVKNNPYEFAEYAIKLYSDKNTWYQSQKKGIEIINTRFYKDLFSKKCIDHITWLLTNKNMHRSKNFIGAMLQHHTLRSTEFMARWIEEKNKPAKQ